MSGLDELKYQELLSSSFPDAACEEVMRIVNETASVGTKKALKSAGEIAQDAAKRFERAGFYGHALRIRSLADRANP
jgi:hypothetical protein